jgi:protein-S-isoprenylcysteine O-methyltransferase Ste14
MMTNTTLITFIIGSILIILFSWFVSLREGRYHGIPRFFAFEGLLLLGLLQWPVWFKDPLVLRQIFSWLFFLASIYYVIASVMLYHKHASHGPNFENSTRLVTTGLYHYVRHPMYGSLLFLGWGMFLKDISPLTITIIIIITIALFLTCKVEEREMIKRFGQEYKDYILKTKMWIPRVI